MDSTSTESRLPLGGLGNQNLKRRMSPRVPVNPAVLRWARERAQLDEAAEEKLLARFKKLPDWEAGVEQPTLKQLEAFAKAVHIGSGYLFLYEPPEERVPIDDLRTIENKAIERPSPELMDTVYACQRRQNWYKGYALVNEEPECDFVGSANIKNSPEEVAKEMRQKLGFDMETRSGCSTWEEASQLLIRKAEEAGILVMGSGIVGSNTRRSLNPEEFRGFVLSDTLAPLIFVNRNDAKAAQIFTMAHELAHLWLGDSALSNIGVKLEPNHKPSEVWCNKVAAEFLVPLEDLKARLLAEEDLDKALAKLSKVYKVSSLVILRRLLDAKYIDRTSFEKAWEEEKEKSSASRSSQTGGGGDFYAVTLSRVGRKFARALIPNTRIGKTNYRDALRMLGISKPKTLEELGRKAGVIS